MQNKYELSIDLQSGESIMTKAKYRTGDTNSAKMEVTLVNEGLVQSILGEDITWNFEKADHTHCTQNMTNGVSILDAENGVLLIVFENQTLACPGLVRASITFTKDGVINSTIMFAFAVGGTVNGGDLSINYITDIETKIAGWQTEFDLAENTRETEFVAIKDAYAMDMALSAENANLELVASRKGEMDLPTKITKMDTATASNTSQLADIPSQTYITEKAKTSDMNTALAIRDTQIASLASGSPKGIYVALANITTAFPSGNTNIYLTSGNGNWNYWNGTTWVSGGTYQATGIPSGSLTKNYFALKSVSSDKTDFMINGKNLFDTLAKSLIGNWVNYVNGLYESYPTNGSIATYYYSAPIAISPSTAYIRKYGSDGTSFFTANMTFISGSTSNTFTTPSNAVYAILNIGSTARCIYEQLELGSVATIYESFGTKMSRPLLSSVVNNMIAQNAVTTDKTNFIFTGKNIYNVKTISATIGQWINYSTGVLEAMASYRYSTPILVLPNTNYVRVYSAEGTAFFDANMVYISGTTSKTFLTPVNCAYVILDMLNAHILEQLELGTVSTVYERFTTGMTLEDSNIYKLNLPPKIYTVLGKEANIYFDNLMIDDASKYNLDVICSVGQHQDERFKFIPTVAGTQDLTIEVRKNYGDGIDLLTKATTSVITVATSAGSGLNKKYLVIGDSTTKGMIDNGELVNLFNNDVMDITLLGSQGVAPNLSEGYPGQDTNYIATNVASPFIFSGVFDFTQYMTAKGYVGVDFVGLNMGINDMFSCANDSAVSDKITTAMAQFETMITSIHAFDANIKIGMLITIPPAHSQDAFGVIGNEPTGQTRARHKRNIMLWSKQLLLQFGNREGSNLFIVPYGSSLDTVNNFNSTTELANSRSAVMVTRENNSLHPGINGYPQMADSTYYWLKNMV